MGKICGCWKVKSFYFFEDHLIFCMNWKNFYLIQSKEKFGQSQDFQGIDNGQNLGADLFFFREHLAFGMKIEKYVIIQESQTIFLTYT